MKSNIAFKLQSHEKEILMTCPPLKQKRKEKKRNTSKKKETIWR